MGFREKYTTVDLQAAQALLKPEGLKNIEILESAKTVIGADAYAIGHAIDFLIHEIKRVGARWQ